MVNNVFMFALDDVKDPKRAEEFQASQCTECSECGPLVTVTNADEIDNLAHQWASAHVTATGHTKIAVWKVSYNPGEMVDMDALAASLRRTKPNRRTP